MYVCMYVYMYSTQDAPFMPYITHAAPTIRATHTPQIQAKLVWSTEAEAMMLNYEIVCMA